MSANSKTAMQKHEETAAFLTDALVACFRGEKPGTTGKVRTRCVVYETPNGKKARKGDIKFFCGISICPEKKGQKFGIDVVATLAAFDKIDHCGATNFQVQKNRKGGSATKVVMCPHLRIMGFKNGLLVMYDAFLEHCNLDT